MAAAITDVRVAGTVEVEESQALEHTSQEGTGAELGATGKGISAEFKSSTSTGATQKSGIKATHKGMLQHRVHFGRLSSALSAIVAELERVRVWVFLDEWSAIPNGLQPLLADLLRRSMLPVHGITLKIGAIEHRSNFQEAGLDGDYVGIELGADVSADVNLDDFMVFDNSADRAKMFFAQLIHKHSVAIAEGDGTPLPQMTADELVAKAFTRRDVFEEYVRASEGVPRDAINILSLAARQAGHVGISMENVRVAARLWYERDKQPAVDANPAARELLFMIIDEVIAHRRTRAFLLKSGTRNPLIDELFDKRVLHILKRNISTKDEPGVRYDVFKIDYGCYVDLLTTAKAPQGLLFDDDRQQFIDVPPDDYRAIRRAILTVESLNSPRLANSS